MSSNNIYTEIQSIILWQSSAIMPAFQALVIRQALIPLVSLLWRLAVIPKVVRGCIIHSHLVDIRQAHGVMALQHDVAAFSTFWWS